MGGGVLRLRVELDPQLFGRRVPPPARVSTCQKVFIILYTLESRRDIIEY